MRICSTENTGLHRVRALVCALALVLACALGRFAAAETDGMLRVRLTRLGAPKSVTLTADCDYRLASDSDVRIAAGDAVTVTADEGMLTMTVGKRRTSLGATALFMRSEPGDRGIKFVSPELSNRFCGDLGLSASGGVITAVLHIYIENYLYGVVGYCMPPSAGLEALKAEAVAARTWALRRRAAQASAPFDLTDSGAQVFKGYSADADYANAVRAVNDTRGCVLCYDGALAQCVVCASNGGQIEASHNAGGPALDYSVVRDDPYDYESKSATVRTARISKDLSDANAALYEALNDGVRDQLEARGVSDAVESFRLMRVERVTACESRFPAPSRLYKCLTFHLTVTATGKGGATRTGEVSVNIPTYGAFEEWYGLSINAEDNETVWVSEDEHAFTVAFRRSGSGVGMSQRGAQVMAEKGMRASDILAFYYPNTEGKRLELSDATRDDRAAAAVRGRVLATARLSNRTSLVDEPSAGSAAVATFAAGAVVDIYGIQGEWAAVGSGGKYGYISADDLESFTLAGTTVNRPDGATYARVLKETPVMRFPVEGAEVLGRQAEGDTVRIEAWTDDWAMVHWNGQNGFLPMDAVEFVDSREIAEADKPEEADPDVFVDVQSALSARLKQDAPLFETANELSSTVEYLEKGDTVQVLAYSQDWARVKTRGGREGCLRQESIAAITEEEPASEIEGGEIHYVKGKKYMYVSARRAAVYASWSGDSELVGTLFYGERVQIGAYNAVWGCVRMDGRNAYVRLEDLSDAKPSDVEGDGLTRPKAGFAAALRQDAWLYTDLSADARQSAMLTQGQRVTVEAYNGVWALVRVDGEEGFVKLQYLEKVKGR